MKGKISDKDVQKVLTAVPGKLPFYLQTLTAAGHLHAAGYDVQEQSLHEDGYPCCGLIFAPVIVQDEEKQESIGTIDLMFEIRVNTLVNMQMAANDCNVNYRTIQRWRDEGKIFPVKTADGKQLFPSEIVKDYALPRGIFITITVGDKI